MARSYECGECEHVQVVGVVDNGLAGFADPDARCENCGSLGKFHFGPGAARRLRESLEHPVLAELPDAAAFVELDRLARALRDGGP